MAAKECAKVVQIGQPASASSPETEAAGASSVQLATEEWISRE